MKNIKKILIRIKKMGILENSIYCCNKPIIKEIEIRKDTATNSSGDKIILLDDDLKLRQITEENEKLKKSINLLNQKLSEKDNKYQQSYYQKKLK